MWKRSTAKFSFQVCIYSLTNTLAYCRKSDVTPFIAVVVSSVSLSEILSVSIFSYSVSGYLLPAALIKIPVFWRRYFVLHCSSPIPRPKMLFSFWIFLWNVITLTIKSTKNMPNMNIYYRFIHKKLRFCNHTYNNQMSVCPSQPIFPKLGLQEE